MVKEIYLDNAATTKVWPEVVKEMNKYYLEEYGNASSSHELGERARAAIDNVRKVIADEIGGKASEIYFTSGGTESNNIAILGLAAGSKKRRIVISAIEHPAVIEVTEELKRRGFEIVRVGVDNFGMLNLEELERVVNNDTLLVSVMHVNNDIGVVQDIDSIGAICKKKGVIFHSDCAQSFGKEKIDVSCGISLLSGVAHKIGGPKGVGFLYVRDGLELSPIIFGGGQEKGLRSGTENVPGIVGMGKALELQRQVDFDKIKKMRDKMMEGLERIGGKINGSKDRRVYNNIHISFQGIESETAIVYLSERGIYVSAGSACDSRNKKEDHVLKAIGLDRKSMEGSLRFSLGSDIKEDGVDHVVKNVKEVVEKLRL